MKVGDFVISRHGPIYSSNMIVCIRQLEPIRVYTVNSKDSQYLVDGRHAQEFIIKPSHIIVSPTLREIADSLKVGPLIAPNFKDKFSEWLKQRVIAEFGEPPKKIVEADPVLDSSLRRYYETDYKNYAKPLVEEGQVSSFIRIIRREELLKAEI